MTETIKVKIQTPNYKWLHLLWFEILIIIGSIACFKTMENSWNFGFVFLVAGVVFIFLGILLLIGSIISSTNKVWKEKEIKIEKIDLLKLKRIRKE